MRFRHASLVLWTIIYMCFIDIETTESHTGPESVLQGAKSFRDAESVLEEDESIWGPIQGPESYRSPIDGPLTFRGPRSVLGNSETFVFSADDDSYDGKDSVGSRVRRDTSIQDTNETTDTFTKVTHLNDTHKQLMVHWVSGNSKVVICLARDPAPGAMSLQRVNPSAVYISYDDGDTYANKTDSFKLANGSYATLEKFYNHPTFNTHFVFTDIRHNVIYTTTNFGKDFKRIDLKFTPTELLFHELLPSTFVVLDKNDTKNNLYVSNDFGETFRQLHEYVKFFSWVKDGADNIALLIQRYEPSGLSNVMFTKNIFENERKTNNIVNTNVQDFFMKGDYLFFTKKDSKDNLQLTVSYKADGPELACEFDTNLDVGNYFIVDVTNHRALVAATHSEMHSNLYVSDDLRGTNGKVKFTLSMEDVFAFFPNSTWKDTWLHHIQDDAFADVYKVEGMTGIYIASKVVKKPTSNNLGPHNLGSYITFDHGASWRLIQPPANDVEHQSTGCLPSSGCSLHLSQKFNQLYPESRSVSILSSKSAPGIIIATGVLGSSLKGHYGVYISLDAGLTWRQTLRDLYFFNMGDHGGVLSAVKYYKSKGETRHILYSIDEGETWNQTQFHNEEIRLYGLMTEPGENTTVFTMFGSLPKEHSWIIVKVDFQNVFKSRCTDKDYKMWSPSQTEENRSYIPCIMGEQTTYQRRQPHAKCLNGLDYVRILSKQRCDCDYLDFECDFGFTKASDTVPPRCIEDKSLTSLNPSFSLYVAPPICPPGAFYNRTKGYRKISGDQCIGGFENHYVPDKVPCPFQEVNDFLLFAQRETISRYNLVTKKLETLPISNLKNVIAIDFDLENNCAYWADIATDVISRQCFTNGSRPETLISSDLASIEGMAFDWISNNLYFVDGVRAKIELIRTNITGNGRMRRTILNGTVLKKPRGIALHPVHGYMFWTDWSAENPSVNRANLDGSNNFTLFGKEKVEWPNGITIDYIANRIYWVDARQDYIGSSDLHGDAFLKIVHNTDVVSHPFAIAVFKNNMYWDDWKKNAIYSADKDIYKGVDVVVRDLQGMMDLKVYAYGIQIGSNGCSNASCPYVCVGLPRNKYACLCPDGLEQAADGKCLCPGGSTPYPNGTCQLIGNTCSSEHFACGTGVCIPKGWRCDGENDCGDNSDEQRCGMSTCPPTFHVCGDGKCLPPYWRCDYDTDCADGSDEVNCPRQKCTESQFACENGRCISMNWRCDGENDCRDNSDERNCDADKPTTCKGEDEFQCKSGAVTCIPSTWKCDDEPDCRDGSDELNCVNNTCSDLQFSCGPPNFRCIFNTWLCDGDKDCPDGRDEKNCTMDEVPKHPSIDFNARNRTCQDWMFRCQNDKCVPFWWHCDGVDDCGDASDEFDCLKPVVPTSPAPSTTPRTGVCSVNEFQCRTGSCILASYVCDHSYDCPDGSDEHNCPEFDTCSAPNKFRCRVDGNCILMSKVCDGKQDCPDKTDESFCDQNLPNEPATPSCSVGFFPCDGGSCYPLSVMCNGRVDCHDLFDEMNCTSKSRVYQVMQMGIDSRLSNDTALTLYWSIQHDVSSDLKLEYMPSISKVGSLKWDNQSWTSESEYQFIGLEPYTKYNMTVYVRQLNSIVVFPPAKYYVATTLEGKPSPPWNVTVKQMNSSHVLVAWNKPQNPKGLINGYVIAYRPVGQTTGRLEEVPVGSSPSHMLNGFMHGVTYTFMVMALNGLDESNYSESVILTFDGETNLTTVENLKSQSNGNNITLTWTYEGTYDSFKIEILSPREYPVLPPYTTKTTNATLSLAPGVIYYLTVYPVKKTLQGPPKSIPVGTLGNTLPMVKLIQAITVKDVGTTVKLSWERPEKKVNWVYGIYYGVSQEQLFKKAMNRTINLTATIPNLDACETYMFAVGIVGPFGYGPLSDNIQVTTSSNPKAPPKKVSVLADENNPLKMIVTWQPSCQSMKSDYYIVTIRDSAINTVNNTYVDSPAYPKTLSHTFDILQGGVYTVQVKTGIAGAIPSKPVMFYAPPILPPAAMTVVPETNGSFSVYWRETSLPEHVGSYQYEVLVNDGDVLNEKTAQKFLVNRPPFIYTNFSAPVYSFAVRIKTVNGLVSLMTAQQSKLLAVTESPAPESSTNVTAIVVPTLLILLALAGGAVFFVIRNRRTQNSFIRFANSHYNSRSGAATFDDHGLEEEDSPQIVGFSDDEPLVVA